MAKVAIITGAGSGIGRAVSLALRKAGWNVVLAGRREEQLAATAALGEGPPCLVQPTDGAVRIRGELVNGPSADRAMVFQEFNLLPWRTARGNVEMPLEVQGVSKVERWRITQEALAQVGLEKFADFFPHQLSGGMKQRVGLARALSINPSYLFMDEPFGALDPQIREIMQIELMKLWDSGIRKTVLFVTHSVDEAVFLSDRVIMFGTQPGRVIADLAISLPRPRWRDEEMIKSSAEFVTYRKQIWQLLKQQLVAATEAPEH